MRDILKDARPSGKLYEVACIAGPGPKWTHKIVTAANLDEAIEKVNQMGYDARSAWTYDFEN